MLDLGSGSGMDVFCAATSVGATGRVVGVDFTDAQIANAESLAERNGIDNVRVRRGGHRPAPVRRRQLRRRDLERRDQPLAGQAPRVRRGGPRAAAGRSLAIADIVSATPLKEATRRNTELWAACIAGAIPSNAYLDELAAAGFAITETRPNDYRFISERALDACQTYGVESVSIAATRGGAK